MLLTYLYGHTLSIDLYLNDHNKKVFFVQFPTMLYARTRYTHKMYEILHRLIELDF